MNIIVFCKKTRFQNTYHWLNRYISAPNLLGESSGKKIIPQDRKKLCFKEDKSHFSSYGHNIISDIPISYIEGYGNILERATYLFPDCKIIFTANAHFYNELFKVWCAERVNSGKKLIISDHGVTATKYNNFSHEDKISDLHVGKIQTIKIDPI